MDEGVEFTPEQLQQHPDAMLLLMLLTGLMIAIVFGSLAMSLYAVLRVRAGKPLLQVEPWTPRVWGFLDLFLVGILVFVVQTLCFMLWAVLSASNLAQLKQEGDFPLSAMAVGSLSSLLVMALTIGWLIVRYNVSLSHIGFTSKKFRSHIAIGVGAALLALPWVYLVMALVSTGLQQKYEHPLLDQLTKEGTLSAFMLAFFAAVIAAPLTEEFLFRVLLQGWLQSIPFSGRHFWWLIGATERERGIIDAAETMATGEHALRDMPDAEVIEPQVNPYLPPVLSATVVAPDSDPQLTAAEPLELPIMQAPPVWPVFVSGTLFGLAHWSYGLSFVPLILLGIILGFLYRATHSIWPSLVVHFILNFIAIMSMGIMTYVKQVIQ